ncbi:hypothetical protein GWK47_016459 [Chionoecetes opilio]|uniref:Uncharacterized protein n=1 Tax=Chionoecetes opilio TaxID=41210 RepID=A0A8J4XRR2_CHIOP|nr:hypothetical protein GWK47_016459 [Chionoecetes opilio]
MPRAGNSSAAPPGTGCNGSLGVMTLSSIAVVAAKMAVSDVNIIHTPLLLSMVKRLDISGLLLHLGYFTRRRPPRTHHGSLPLRKPQSHFDGLGSRVQSAKETSGALRCPLNETWGRTIRRHCPMDHRLPKNFTTVPAGGTSKESFGLCRDFRMTPRPFLVDTLTRPANKENPRGWKKKFCSGKGRVGRGRCCCLVCLPRPLLRTPVDSSLQSLSSSRSSLERAPLQKRDAPLMHFPKFFHGTGRTHRAKTSRGHVWGALHVERGCLEDIWGDYFEETQAGQPPLTQAGIARLALQTLSYGLTPHKRPDPAHQVSPSRTGQNLQGEFFTKKAVGETQSKG